MPERSDDIQTVASFLALARPRLPSNLQHDRASAVSTIDTFVSQPDRDALGPRILPTA